MAVVKTIKYPNGPIVRIMDDDIAPDQAAAWAHAIEVHARVHWEIERKKLAEGASKAQTDDRAHPARG